MYFAFETSATAPRVPACHSPCRPANQRRVTPPARPRGRARRERRLDVVHVGRAEQHREKKSGRFISTPVIADDAYAVLDGESCGSGGG